MEAEKHFKWTYLDPRLTVVVDDNWQVWGHGPNVIHCHPYKFFKCVRMRGGAEACNSCDVVCVQRHYCGQTIQRDQQRGWSSGQIR